ncbi:WD repeat-containing protein 97 isoform X3 [Hyperolius riggenbachi]|uniref:WD repeat-containing protein 97 isoform X3 n=1 Tax=Hyperolius riggenbachi TaxID=752182 RepID=UPI0035A376D3
MEGHPGIIDPVNISSKDGNHPHNTRHLWRQLREDFRRVVAMMKKEDAKPLVLNHGLEPMRHLSFLTKLRCVKHVSEQQCLFSLDCDGNVHLHHEDGRILSHTQLPWPISGLLYADGVDHYVAWSQKELLLLDKTFALVSQSSVKDNVFCCVYYPGRKLVLSGGDGGVSVWNFGLSRRSLVLQQSLGVKPQDKVTIIAIDAESHTGCTCLAVCGTSVWEFDLTDGSLRRVRKNLHLRTITSLVYSEILRLLITGSRDQTIKVWAGEGHLIAVFVGHTGSDSMVKVWRFFPYSAGSLSLHMSFSCSHPVGRMCSFKSQLFVAFHDTQSAAYSLVQYCLRTGNRKEHPPTDDHQDQITGLCSCAALRLVATSGRDGKIRLWDEDNRLIRTLCLNSTPDCLAFTGDRGDLLVAIHSHLYRINLFKHLPRSYQVKIMCMKPPSVTRDPPITIPSDYLMSLSEDDRRRLSQPQSLLHGYFAESLHAEHDGKNGEQEQGYSLLSARDQDLNLILQGKIRPRKKPKRSKDTRREAMERYLQLFYRQRPRIVISEEDDINGEELCPDTPREDPFIPPNSNKGFFTDSALGFSIHSLPRHLQSPFLSVGTIPNSAILQLLWPVECQSKTEELHPAKKYEHLMFKNISIGEEEKKENEDTEEKVEEYTEDVEEDNDIPAILQKITASIEEQKISPSSSDTGLVPPPSPPPPPAGQEQGEKKASLPDKSILSRIPRPRPQQTKRSYPPVISEKPTLQDPPIPAVPKMSPVPAPPSPDSDREEHEETPPIVQETPVFILQFQDCSWFSSIFTDAQMEPSEFESRLLFGVVHSELLMRIQLLHALRSLYQQGYLKDLKGTFRTIVDVVESFVGTSLKAKEKLDFLWLCLRFLIELSGSNRQLVLALLMSCVLVHPSHRERFLSLFRDIGVEDPHGFIGRQVSAWDTWEHTENIRTLKRTCEDWLESWTVLLTDFLRSAMSQDPQKSHRDRGKAPPTSQSQGHIRSSQRQVDSLAIDVAPSDVLNYFCEVQLRKEIQQMRGAAPGDGSTVLALPPIHRKRALLRLGESRMYVKPRDQKDVFLPQIPQKLLPNIIPFINLPLKKVSLCPFATTSERPGAPHLTGSLKQDVHRYFILQQSYLESYY